MSYTLGMAAKAAGKSKTTIQRAIVKGLISGNKEKNGRYSIDPSELHRVFPTVSGDTVAQPSQVDTSRPLDETPLLQAKIESLEELLIREREVLEEVRIDRDAWKQQATALLPAPAEKQRPWWQWR